jgi:hypothetical protein
MDRLATTSKRPRPRLVNSDGGIRSGGDSLGSDASSPEPGAFRKKYEFVDEFGTADVSTDTDSTTLGESEPEDDDAGEALAEMNQFKLVGMWHVLIETMLRHALVMLDGEEINVGDALSTVHPRQEFEDMIVQACLSYHVSKSLRHH